MSCEKLAYRVEEAKHLIGTGTTKLYQLIGTGALDARKIGTSTVITGESLRAYVANLPKADIRTGQTPT